MTKFNTKSLLIIVVILLISITALWQIQRRASPAAAWFSDAWQYRKAINIGYTGATALTDFQVSVDIGTSALIAAGKMKSDCSDIRFTDQNGNLLNYWIEENNPGCNQITDTKIWIKVPSVKTSGTNIYIYYGNSSATSFQDGNKVFLMFDNFTSNISWSSYEGTTNISGGTLVFTPTGSGNWKHYTVTDQDNISGQTSYIVEHRYKTAAKAGGTLIRYVDNNNFWGLETGYNNLIQIRGYAGGVEKFLTSGAHTYSINTYVIFKTIYDGSTHNVKVFADGSQIINYNVTGGDQLASTTSVGVIDHLGYGPSTSDWIFVRKYAASDPTKTLLDEERSLAPIAHWSFDEGVGTTAYDSSSNRNNGIFGTGTSAPIWQTEDQCVVGKCLKFDSNDYVSIGDFGESPMTLSLWIKPSTTNDDQRIISNIDNSKASSPAFSLRFQSNKIQIWGTSWKDITTSTIPINKWTHIVVIVNSSGQAIGFVNGKQEVTAATDTYNFYSLGIGSKFIFSGNTAGNYYNGFIDEPKIYAYARTAAQIKQDYRAGLAGMKTQKGSSVAMGGSSGGKSLSDGLVGYWKMDEGVGTTTADSSGNNNTGTITGAVWGYGKYGIGISFNGGANYLNVGSSAIDNATVWSINTQIKYINQAKSFEFLLGRNDNTNTGKILLRHDGYISFRGSNGTYYDFSTASTEIQNTSKNISFVSNGTTISLYIDGVFKSAVTPASTSLSINVIGNGWTDNVWSTICVIDEIRFYNRALSYDEVRQLAEYAPGPVAYYDFEEGVGTTAFDKSGNGNNAVWSSNNYTTGKIGKAGNFTSSNYVTLKNIDSLDIVGPITISAWVYPTTMNAANIIFSRGGGSANNCQYLLNIESGSPRFYMGNTNDLKSASAPTILTNKWHYLTGIFDGTKTYIYVNGVGISGGSITNQTHNTSYASRIGAYSHAGTYPFAGLIDEVKIYNYARTQKQILQDMNASAPVGGMSKINKPIAWYKFDEGYGTVANNSGSIGSTLNGTFGPGTSAPTWVTGKSGKGLSFDGNDYVWLGNQSILSPNNITISSWFKVNADGTIIRNRTYGYNLRTSGNKVVAGLYENSNNQIQISSTMNINDNKWHQATMTYNGTALKLYIDGVYNNSTNGTGTNAIYYVEKAIAIGRDADNPSNHFNGLIDEVKIYNYALSEDEIKQDYNQGATAVIGKSNQTIGATTTSLDYCIPGDTSHCAAPIAEYNFEEGVGTTAYDKSGNGNHCYTSNNPLWVSGKTGGALQFNGSNQRCTKTGGVTIGQITAQAWVYRTSSTTNQGIIRQQNSFILSLKDDTIQLGGTSFLNTGITIPLNSWQHVAWTNNGNNNILFINGQEKWRNSGGTLPNNTNDLNVAYDNNNWWWGGKIDSVKIYNYARTPAQIAYDYNKGAPIAHWKMDECQGTTINDSSGNNNHGTLTIGVGGSQSSVGTCQSSGAWYNGRTGKINSAMSFDGTDDYINIDSSLNTIKSLTTGSISFWFNKQSSERDALFFFGQASTTDYFSILHDDQNKIEYTVWQAGQNVLLGKTNNAFTDWTHVVIVISNSGNTFFVNGKQQTVTYSAGNSSSTNFFATQTNPTIVSLAKRNLNTFENWLTGKLDDVRIYNYALTAEQVKSVYNGGSINFR